MNDITRSGCFSEVGRFEAMYQKFRLCLLNVEGCAQSKVKRMQSEVDAQVACPQPFSFESSLQAPLSLSHTVPSPPRLEERLCSP